MIYLHKMRFSHLKISWFIALVLLFSMPVFVFAIEIGCSASARYAYTACGYSVKDDLHAERAICMDGGGDDLDACLADLDAFVEEEDEECDDIHEARLNLCEVLNDQPYEPDFGEDFVDNFINPLDIGNSVTPNLYFPLVQGNVWVYEANFVEDGEEVTETITVSVLNETKLIQGITCLVVQDVVVIDGELIEDTDDWFAQDVDGNVWYCGEEVKDYETFEEDQPALPELISDDGSFKAGVDRDKAGILLFADPVVGTFHRQEMSIGNAEDTVEILAIDANESSPMAVCQDDCLQTFDYSTLDPEAMEHKFYKPSVGLIIEVDLETGDRAELIDFTSN